MEVSTIGQHRREVMGRDPIWRLLFRFSGPAIISMTVASTYNLVDAIFVGRLGPTPLAAMTVTYPLVLSLIAIASGTGIGTTSLISRSLGAGDHTGADRTAGVAISLCFLLSGLIALTCLPNLDGILRLLGAEEAVLPPAKSYISILIMFILFSYLSLILSQIIRADGNPLFSSSVSISSSLLNIMLDPLLIFGLGPFPALGIRGAAIATVIAQGAGVSAYLYYLLSGRSGYTFRSAHFVPAPKIVAGIYRIGVASIIRSGVQFLVMGVANKIAASFGVLPLAVLGVLVRTGRFILMPCLGLGQGLLPLIGYNFGSGRMKRVAELIFKTGSAGLIWTGLCWIILMIFPERIISAFNSDADFINEGAPALRLYAMVTFIIGLQMVPGFFFQGIGKGLPAIVLSSARHILFLLPALMLLSNSFGLIGIWISFPAADVLSLLLAVTWLGIEFRNQGISFQWWKY